MASDSLTSMRVRITEVAPRDGLQNEKASIDTATKVQFIDRLARTGVAEIEVSSFVSPRWVPQLADADEVFARIQRVDGVIFSALAPNERGLDRALAAGAGKISVFTAASETFNERNINASVDESLKRIEPVVRRALEASRPVRGYVSCVVACPYEGPIEPARVAEVSRRLLDLGVDELDLGETIGVATPNDIRRLYDAIEGVTPPAETALHMHDTRGTGLACVIAALDCGVRRFDSSAGGLGGCPYAPGAAGNLATEDLVYALERLGYDTGVQLDRVVEASRLIETKRGLPLPGRVYQAMSNATQCQ